MTREGREIYNRIVGFDTDTKKKRAIKKTLVSQT